MNGTVLWETERNRVHKYGECTNLVLSLGLGGGEMIALLYAEGKGCSSNCNVPDALSNCVGTCHTPNHLKE